MEAKKVEKEKRRLQSKETNSPSGGEESDGQQAKEVRTKRKKKAEHQDKPTKRTRHTLHDDFETEENTARIEESVAEQLRIRREMEEEEGARVQLEMEKELCAQREKEEEACVQREMDKAKSAQREQCRRQQHLSEEARRGKEKAKAEKQQLKNEKDAMEQEQAAQEEITRKQKRRRDLDRQRNAEELETESTPNVPPGQKRKVSAMTPNLNPPRGNFAMSSTSASTGTSHPHATNTNASTPRPDPPIFDLSALGGQPNSKLKKLLEGEAEAQQRQRLSSRPELQKSHGKEVTMRQGFKTTRQALLKQRMPPSSDAQSNVPSLPSLPMQHQVPEVRPGSMKSMQKFGAFWHGKSKQTSKSSHEGSSSGKNRKV